MPSRRDFIAQAGALGVITAASSQISCAAEVKKAKATVTIGKGGARIKSVVRREETVLRHGGNGDNFHMSWAADDRQYISL